MTDPKIPVIPESYIQFAKDVADLAEKAGMSNFLLKYTPDSFETGIENYRNVEGDVLFYYSANDGRGRPSKNLSVTFKANVSVPIISSPNSY